MNLEPKAITAAFIGLKSKLAAFRLQRAPVFLQDWLLPRKGESVNVARGA